MANHNLFRLLRDGYRRAVQEHARHLPELPGAYDPGLEQALDDLDSPTQGVENAGQGEAWNAAAGDWQTSLDALAARAFARSPGQEDAARDELPPPSGVR